MLLQKVFNSLMDTKSTLKELSIGCFLAFGESDFVFVLKFKYLADSLWLKF
jgi:hypothetical protein